MIKCTYLVETIYKESERTNQLNKEKERTKELIDKTLNEQVKFAASMGATKTRVPLKNLYTLNNCIYLSRKDIDKIAEEIATNAGYRTSVNSSSIHIDWSHKI